MKLPIYMDNHATTPIDPRVLDAMMPYFTEKFGNAASRNHTFGFEAEAAVEEARRQVAALIGADHREIVFTSGATESDNLAVKGVATMYREHGDHIITCVTEHKAILDSCKHLEKEGYKVTFLPVDDKGLISLDDLRAAITDQTILVSVMYANNEVGTIEPIAEIGRICRAKKIPFHIDAVQAGGSLPLDVADLNADLLSLSAHKFYGPKGVGILYARQGMRLLPQLQGGSQERGRRAGTENVAGIIGAAAALRVAYEEHPLIQPRIMALRDRLIDGLLAIPGSQLTGHPTNRLANNASFCFEGVEGESILLNLDLLGVAASTGSACTSGSVDPSHVLVAMGIPVEVAHGSLRLTLGKNNTDADVDVILSAVPGIIEKLRGLRG